jgi:16S rRNA (adenine1518-N6/adenine1519-N6)-dimethyltransferase
LHRLFNYANHIDSIHIVIQLEVAQRIVAQPGRREYGYLSAACQFYTEPKIALRLPSGAFSPPPKVESALVEMNLPGERARLNIAGSENETRFLKFVQACFSQKRKTLRNNLRAKASDERIHAVFAAAKLRLDARAEQLTLPDFATLFQQIL